MNATERRKKIESLLIEKKELDVSDINNMFDVSGVTIRNDLIYLERKGVAKRLFGKIVLRSDVNYSIALSDTKNIAEKEKIGKYAASLIKPGISVLFYAGSTTQQIIRFLDHEINFIAVTNSVTIAQELRSLPNASIVMIGGNFSHSVGATYGLQAIKQFQEYNYDLLFLSVDGIDSEMGITNKQPFESDVNRVIIERSNTIVVVADNSKIGNVTFVQMGDITDVDMLITDAKASSEAIEKIRSKGIKVVTT
jgi:DeoR family transcriptional regulator, aga operon transcriptional repressor